MQGPKFYPWSEKEMHMPQLRPRMLSACRLEGMQKGPTRPRKRHGFRHTQASAKQRDRRSLALQRPPVSQGDTQDGGHPQTLLQIYPGGLGGGKEYQLISAEQWTSWGDLCAQENWRLCQRGLYLLELRLTIPRTKPEQLSGGTADCRQNPHSPGVISLFQL